MSKSSKRFGLTLPEEKDYYDVNVFNNNFVKIDEMLPNAVADKNGYVELGGGLIIQWGYVEPKTLSAENIKFSIPFKQIFNIQHCTCLGGQNQIMHMETKDGAKVRVQETIEVYSITEKGFWYFPSDVNILSDKATQMHWLAIGLKE